MIVLYDHPLSGNGHKVRLFLSMIGLSYQSVHVDVLARVNRSPAFLVVNPLGQVPVLSDDGMLVRDGQAILVYLASRYTPEWAARTPVEWARLTQWLSFAAHEIGSCLQPARLHYLIPGHLAGVDIQHLTQKSLEVLHVLDSHLQEGNWLASERPTVADLACFPYVGLAREGRLPLDDYGNVVRWIDRIAALPGYVTMPGLPGSASLAASGDESRIRQWVDAYVDRNRWTRFG